MTATESTARTIRPRGGGGVWQTDKGTWSYKFGRVVDGRRVQMSKGGFASKREAETALRTAIADYERGGERVATDRRMTLRQFVDGPYAALLDERCAMASRTDGSMAPNTRLAMENILRAYVLPTFGDRTLTSIKTTDIKSLYRRLASPGAKRNGAPLADSSRRQVHATLTSVFTVAMEQGCILVNPLTALGKRDRPTAGIGRGGNRVTVWSADEQARFLATVDARLTGTAEAEGVGYWLMLRAGLRRGEALGLRWSDLDLDASPPMLSVRATRVKVGPRIIVGPPKTAESERTIPISATLAARLRQWRARQSEALLAIGHRPANLFVMTGFDGMPVHPDTPTRMLARLVRAADVPMQMSDEHRVTPHGLRHTAGSAWLDGGVPLPKVSKMLGHSSVAITMARYSHSLGNTDDETAALLNAVG